jgi:multidrug efflux pump
VALTFTPALCGTLLRPPKPDQDNKRRGLFYWFNRGFDRTNTAYSAGVKGMVKRPIPVFVVFAVVLGCLALMYSRIPGGFLPDEDQGVLFVQVTTPPGASAGITEGVLDDVTKYFRTKEANNVLSVFQVTGFSFGGQGQNAGLAFISLKDSSARSGAVNKAPAIVGRAMGAFSQFNRAQIFAFAPPAALELGNATGFDFELLDRGNKGHAALMAARNQLLGAAAHDPTLKQVRPNGSDDEPQYRLDIDREKASALGVTIADINSALGDAWGSSYVNDFIDRGRVKRVFIQGEIGARMEPSDLDHWYVRNSAGAMTPFGIFTKGTWISGSPRLERYGGIASIEILGSPAAGQSSGTAIATMQRLATKLPPGFTSAFTGLSYEELQAGSQTTYLYALAITVVFLSLAALYESWAIPLAVLLVIPLGVLGVVAATLVRGLDNDIYFQVGMLTTIGLSAKNAILIVEFANDAYNQGKGLVESALVAAGERLRPILMTSLAFMLGVLPLAISTGAGSGGQNAIGTAVVGGMLSATVLAIFFVPVFFVTVLGVFRVKSLFQKPAEGQGAPAA